MAINDSSVNRGFHGRVISPESSAGGHTTAKPFQYPVAESLWFNHKVIKLDGWVFIGCRFDNCKIVIETPNFQLRNCYLGDNNSYEINGSLINAMQFMSLACESAGYMQYRPVRNPDGTISIGF